MIRQLNMAALLPVAVLLTACVQPPPPPEPPPTLPGKVVDYICTGNKPLTVTYGDGTVTLEGPETLLAEEGNPNRYSWPSDGTHHIWELSGGQGTLSLSDGAKGTVTVQKSGCKPKA